MNSAATQYVQNTNIDHYSKNPVGFLKWIVKKLPNKKVIMGTGFGPPGIVLLDMLFKVTKDISVFYIDTNFLFDQTYDLKNKLEKRYGFKFLKFSTDLTPEVQGKKYGEKLWESDPDACCNLRKVLPMKKALTDYDFWITGIRKKQTAIRANSELVEMEPRFSVIKLNPLLNWTHNEVWNYIKEHNLPYNELHDRNYPSIGCKPCTSPVCSGDDERSGRWNGTNKTECGLHKSTTSSLDEIKTKAN
tara:strand:+ start:62 stop:799 length:738 start_codon:yes stop_codon:yes gene_type:complete